MLKINSHHIQTHFFIVQTGLKCEHVMKSLFLPHTPQDVVINRLITGTALHFTCCEI
jgi:hypothetical protein